METINSLDGIESLKIYQNDDWFKFSLESILLPNFVTINKRTKKILDMCSGNAPIPIILSTKTNADIYGIEIQKDVYELANKSILINDLQDRVKIINDDVKNAISIFGNDSFDLITVNPPYFKINENSKKNDDVHKTIARHEEKITAEEIIKIASKLLKENGRFAIVHRTERFFELYDYFKKYRIEPKRVQLIYPKKDAESNLVMIEGIKLGKIGTKFLDPLYVHTSNGEYTKGVKKYFR